MSATPHRPRDGIGGGEKAGETPVPSRPNHYRNGRAFEWRTRTHLIDNGYKVLRTAGSKTKVDLVAIKPGELLFVQCKRSGQLPTVEWNDVFDLAVMVGAIPLLAVGGRGHRYWRLTHRKEKRGHRPMVAYHIDIP